MFRFSIGVAVLLSFLFSSCKDYVPYLQCKINGDAFRVETTVNAQYLNNGSFTQCYIQANGTPWDINIRTNGNIPGPYIFSTGTGSPGLLEFYDGTQLFTSNNVSASGQIELVQVGSNLLEGFFSGEIFYGSSSLLISEGEFSARAY